MNLYFRLLRLLSQYAWLRHTQPLDQAVTTKFRVMPSDLDTNLHMNNGRFLTLMDLGRLDLIAKTGLLWPSVRLRIAPVLGAAQMVYLRPLLLGQRFDVITQLECWDHKWFVITQRFERDGALCAQGRVRGVFLRGGRPQAPAQVLAMCGFTDARSPEASAATQAWLQGLKAR